MSKKAIRSERNREKKVKLIRALARRLKDKSIIYYFELIEKIKTSYVSPCRTGTTF